MYFPATVTVAQTSDTVCLPSVSVCTQPDRYTRTISDNRNNWWDTDGKNQAAIQDNSELTWSDEKYSKS